MDKTYIQPAAALKMLKAARSFSHTVYIYGATGYGKTALVRQYLANRRYVYISCEVGLWDSEVIPAQLQKADGDKSCRTVVIDDLQFLNDEEKRQEVRKLFERSDLWLVLVSRSPVPPWLVPDYVRHGFVVIGEKDLYMGEAGTAKILEKYGIQLKPEQLRKMAENAEGNARIIEMAAKMILRGIQPGPELQKEITDMFSDYMENELFNRWPPELMEFLMEISVTDTFTVPLAEMVTGNSYVQRLLDMAFTMGNFMMEKDGVYCLRPVLLKAMRRRAEIVCGRERMREYAYNAGLYYEMHDQIPQALEMYEKNGQTHRIRELLVRNARRNPGNGHYFALRKYYFQLSEAEIGNNVILMAAMSMLYSLMMQPEKSEYWYEKLKTYERTARGSDRKEAKSRLVYLDIALPHRGSRGMLHIMKSIPDVLFDKGIRLPEFSVTSNMPSAMNGGKDFCHWSKYDRELVVSAGKLVQRILGKYGTGFLNAALGESLYEKGGDTYEVLTRLSRAEMETMNDGMIEMAFVATGIIARLHLLNGDIETSKMQINSFEKRVYRENALQLLPNIRALKCRMALYMGDSKAVTGWMLEAPDENQEFYVMERYRYLTKVRCYIASGDLMKALSLLEKLRYYAEMCGRTYMIMEIKMLTAVIRYRQGDEWQTGFMEMLRQASEYKFLRLISEEGPVVSGLLHKIKKQAEADEGIDRKWFERLLKESGDMAVRYPVYMKRQLSAALDFSENALAILRLQAAGLPVREIAEKLGMKPETVRYHTKENYRKLGVSGKTDAVLAARNLNLL